MQKIEEVVLFQIDLTSKVAKQYSQKEFDKLKLGITVEQWVILKIVSESNNLSQKELAQKSNRDPASITRALDLLEKKKLVQRNPTPNNRRIYNIMLTKTGEQFVQDNIDTIIKHRNLSVKGLSKEELENLSETLAKIRMNMK